LNIHIQKYISNLFKYGESSLLLGEVSLFLGELGPFHGENLLLLEKVVVFPWELL